MPCSAGSTACSPAKRARSPPPMSASTGSPRAMRTRRCWSAIRCARAVARLGEAPFPGFDDIAPLRILVTGGSQGASILGQVVPEGLGMLEPSLRHRLQVTQQCRADDIDAVRKRYAELGIPAELIDLYRRHARQARLGASDHRPRRRLDHRRADRGGPPGDPGSAAVGDRRSPDRQCARDGAGGRRADDPAGRLHPGDAGPPDRGDGRRPAGAGQCRRAGIVGRAARTPRATSPIWSSGSAAARRRSRSGRLP